VEAVALLEYENDGLAFELGGKADVPLLPGFSNQRAFSPKWGFGPKGHYRPVEIEGGEITGKHLLQAF
jgi:hypothetical protein